MKKTLCVMRDLKADLFGPVVQFDNDDVAVRSFFDLCRDFSTLPGKYFEDFSLARIAYYDDRSAVVSSCDYTVLANGSDLSKED